jgi:serine/threonine protein kinase
MQAGLGSQAGDAPLPAAGSGSAARVAPTVRYSPSGRFIPPEPAELAARFPQLEILELLGQGGMGAVYKARQRQLNRIVALKILPAETAGDPAFAERFSREAQALAQLNHPHIVTVHDFGEAFVVPPAGGTTSGLFYFLMEFVDGSNLRRMLESGHLSPREALAIVPQVCDALQYAHDEGVVHRDIKPENILIDKKGRVKIADFGLAKLMARSASRGSQPSSSAGAAPVSQERLTYTNQVMGTPHYIAPEQVERPQTVDHRADIYSLGVVFYEMLTGELPLGRFAPPSQKVQVDVRLDEVVLRSLEKEPARRYQHASDVKTDVEQISRSAPPSVPIASTPKAAPQTSVVGLTELELAEARAQVRGPAIGLLITGIIHCLLFPLVLLVGLAGFTWRSSSPPNPNSYGARDRPSGIDDSFERTTGGMASAGGDGPFPERPDAAMTRNPPVESTPPDRGGDR